MKKLKPIQLQLYTKTDCPLCQQAQAILKNVRTQVPGVTIEEIDITQNLGLFTKYKQLIPVLTLGNQQLFVHKIKQRKLVWLLRWLRIQTLFRK